MRDKLLVPDRTPDRRYSIAGAFNRRCANLIALRGDFQPVAWMDGVTPAPHAFGADDDILTLLPRLDFARGDDGGGVRCCRGPCRHRGEPAPLLL
jgi:hypothetical protein